MKIYGDLSSGNCLKVKYTADFLALPYEWVPVDIMNPLEFLQDPKVAQIPADILPGLAVATGLALRKMRDWM